VCVELQDKIFVRHSGVAVLSNAHIWIYMDVGIVLFPVAC
jgi:hypothetical protein